MNQTHGQISARLLTEFGPGSDGWAPPRCAALRTETRPAADGFAVTGRRRRTPFLFALLNITGPSLALMLLLGLTQAAELGYLP